MDAIGEQDRKSFRVGIIVAHPDDETLWAGGLLLSHPEWSPVIVSLCRGSDPDRAPKFRRALERLGATGHMGDLDDGPDQMPLSTAVVQEAVLSLLPERSYDLLVTHAPQGEYTRHRRHEEISQAVWVLWRHQMIHAQELWQFAYEDGGGTYPPQPRKDATLQFQLPESIWAEKISILMEIYGFIEGSWELRASPRTEAFKVVRSKA